MATAKVERSARGATVVARIGALVVLGALLAGCDKCGNWWSPLRGEAQGKPQVCREQAPRPQ
jgi:hypothetical protein